MLASSFIFADRASANPPCDVLDLSLCSLNGGGIQTGVTSVQLDRAKKGLDLQTGAPDKRTFEYTSATTCPNNSPGGPNADAMCQGAMLACAGNTPLQGLGPQVELYRRQVDAKNVPMEGWQLIGTTCLAADVPGRPVLGLGLILAAFHRTQFATPTVHIQPEGDTTLVTLPTYFEVKWRAPGFQPDQIDEVTLMGFRVEIKPTNQGYTYDFGDGTPTLPTASAGGTYPNGDITHVYAKGGQYKSHVDITYGGEFRVNGGEWLTIDPSENVLITGTVRTLTVKTAHARLFIN
jgi:hypothetical protein